MRWCIFIAIALVVVANGASEEKTPTDVGKFAAATEQNIKEAEKSLSAMLPAERKEGKDMMDVLEDLEQASRTEKSMHYAAKRVSHARDKVRDAAEQEAAQDSAAKKASQQLSKVVDKLSKGAGKWKSLKPAYTKLKAVRDKLKREASLHTSRQMVKTMQSEASEVESDLKPSGELGESNLDSAPEVGYLKDKVSEMKANYEAAKSKLAKAEKKKAKEEKKKAKEEKKKVKHAKAKEENKKPKEGVASMLKQMSKAETKKNKSGRFSEADMHDLVDIRAKANQVQEAENHNADEVRRLISQLD